MAVRRFVMWPDARLKTPCAKVSRIDDSIVSLWADMTDTMEAMPGVGLAACQIGDMRRLAVVDASERRGEAIWMANPQVLHASVELREHDEASPNLPGVSARIRRPRAVTVQFVDSDGQIAERDFVGLWATSVQHQIDHLNGRMYFDNLSRVKRQMLLKRATKLRNTA